MFILNQAGNNSPGVLFEGLEALLAFYREVDLATDRFKPATRLIKRFYWPWK